MYRYFIWVLLFSSFVGCSSPSPYFPEEFLLSPQQVSQSNLKTMMNIHFDFQTKAPDNRLYLEHLLLLPHKNSLSHLQTLLTSNIIKPYDIYADGNSLLNYAVKNGSEVSLLMMAFLFDQYSPQEFLKIPRNPLLDIYSHSEITFPRAVKILLKRNFRFDSIQKNTHILPAAEYLKSFTYNLSDFNDLIFETLLKNIEYTDALGQNIWHYIFKNPSKNMLIFANFFLNQPQARHLLLKADKNGVFPIFLLASNPNPETFLLYQIIKDSYKEEYTQPNFINELFLYVLKNESPDLPLFFNEVLSYNPNVNAQDKQGCNTLSILASNKSRGVPILMEQLIKRGVNIYKNDKAGYNVYYYATLNQGEYALEIIYFLEYQGFSIYSKDDEGRNLLSYAVYNKGPSALRILNYLIQRGLPVLEPTPNGQIPMSLLLSNDSPYVTSMLRSFIYSRYQGKANEPYSYDIILNAAKSTTPYSYKNLLTLIQQGFDINALDTQGKNALFYSVSNKGSKAIRMTRLLLLKGLNPLSIDKNGNTLLHYALKNPIHDYAMVDLLLNRKVDVHKKNNNGVSAFYIIQQLPEKKRLRFFQILSARNISIEL